VTLTSNWNLPSSWLTEEHMPTAGIIRLRYYSGEGSGFSECVPDLHIRLGMTALVYSQPYPQDVRLSVKPTIEHAEFQLKESGVGLSFLPEYQKNLDMKHKSKKIAHKKNNHQEVLENII
jgi:hypothetical protein